jgi:hypothetical protein
MPWISVGFLGSTLEVGGIWFDFNFFLRSCFVMKIITPIIQINMIWICLWMSFFYCLWPNYRVALIFFQFCKLQKSTYVVNHVWVKFHQLIIKSKKVVGKCLAKGFLTYGILCPNYKVASVLFFFLFLFNFLNCKHIHMWLAMCGWNFTQL